MPGQGNTAAARSHHGPSTGRIRQCPTLLTLRVRAWHSTAAGQLLQDLGEPPCARLEAPRTRRGPQRVLLGLGADIVRKGRTRSLSFQPQCAMFMMEEGPSEEGPRPDWALVASSPGRGGGWGGTTEGHVPGPPFLLLQEDLSRRALVTVWPGLPSLALGSQVPTQGYNMPRLSPGAAQTHFPESHPHGEGHSSKEKCVGWEPAGRHAGPPGPCGWVGDGRSQDARTKRLSNFLASVMWIQLSFSTTLMCFTSSLNLGNAWAQRSLPEARGP